MPRFAVVVPTYNREATLARAMESVLQQRGDDFELIVVDDGSTDTTGAVINGFGDRVRSLLQANRGVSAARNAGVAATSAPWIIFLDSDDELSPDALARYGEAGERARLVVAGSTRLSPDTARQETVLPDREAILTKRFTPLLAGAFAIRRDLFAHVGGYDEAFAYAENTELAWRLRAELSDRDAIEVIREPLVVVHHRAVRGHAQSRYDAAKLILERRSYDMESDDPRARREWHAQYLGIAAIGAADLGRRREAIALAAKAVIEQPFVAARYRSAAGVVRRVVTSAGRAGA
jgi:glycosyltransferase involved in cell wall biosynthesis